MKTWVVIPDGGHAGPDTVMPVDTLEQIEQARQALRAFGRDRALVYVGDPESPFCYHNGQILWVPEVEP